MRCAAAFVAAAIAACGAPARAPAPQVCFVDRTCVDAAIDACVFHAPDAGSGSSVDCCALLPNYRAASECAAAGVPPTACGELACEQPDCSFIAVSFCGSGAGQ